jgi:LacI family transcriptional regulator
VNAAAHRLGDHLVTFSINYNEETVVGADDESAIDFGMLDGAIVFARQYLLEDIVRLAKRIPVVALSHDAGGVNIPSFFIDFSFHAAVAVQRLAAMGHRRIVLAYDSSPFHDRIGAEMQRGLNLGLLQAGLSPDPHLIHRTDLEPEDGAALYERLRREDPDVTAVISYGSNVLYGMIGAARRHGQDLLETMSLICLTDTRDAKESVQLANFRCPLEQMATDAVETLHAIVSGADGAGQKPVNPESRYRPYYGELLEGQTLRPARQRNRGGRSPRPSRTKAYKHRPLTTVT